MNKKTQQATHKDWLNRAIRAIEADVQRSADTHLNRLSLPGLEAVGIDLYLKDESTHPTGSLKHRLARSLFLYALCNGQIKEGTTVVEASSGSTAVSEAFFARLLGLPFVAVMPKTTSPEKTKLIEFYGGSCHFVDHAHQVYEAAAGLAQSLGGHYMDQFTYAERATDWRGNNNIAQSMFEQMALERFAQPTWVVVGAGTGGTSATIGRHIRYLQLPSQVCVVDPQGSAFSAYYETGDPLITTAGSKIEGIGRPRLEASFIRTVVDKMMVIPDTESLAAMYLLSQLLGRKVGPSTGTNFAGMLALAAQMKAAGRQGSILSLLCDAGERYLPSYYNPQWVDQHIGNYESATQRLQALMG